MYRHDHIPAAGAATRRPLTRCLLLAVASSVLGQLPGIPGLAPAGPAVVQAAQPDQPHAAAPAGGLAGAVPPTGSGPKDYPPNLIVQSTGAADEQLNVAAALDQGTRLFLLQARYQDAGNGQADYYLAGPQGVSHQPVRELFPPLREWLAAPGHEHEMVRFGLRTDPRSANPARFDAACQAFTSALGQYLLKSSDLPAGKAWGELAPDELAALMSRPRVITDWSACTGEEPPIRRPQAHPAAAVPVEDHWMADQADVIGQRPLRQVVLPGSHDAATYDTSNCMLDHQVVPCWPLGPLETDFTEAQSQDITAQLNAGSRYFDLRFGCWDWADDPAHDGFTCLGSPDQDDYWVDHGGYLSRVRMYDVLTDIVTWAVQPGHEREILVLTISIDNSFTGNSNVLNGICGSLLGGAVLQPSIVPPNTTLYDMSMNEIWALPGHPRIITNWSDCTGQTWPPAPPPGTAATPYGGYYADGCTSADIVDRLAPRLEGRLDGGGDSASPNAVTGLYGLQVSATPEVGCAKSVLSLAPEQKGVLDAIKGWWAQDQHNAPANLNIMPGDYLGDPAGESGWPIVQTALGLNQNAQAPQLSLKSDPTAFKPVTVTCDDPRGTPPTLVVYPAAEGAQSPNRKTFTGAAGATSVQANLSVEDFPPPTGPVRPVDVTYLRAECAQGAAPSQSSRIVIPLHAFGTLPFLGATPTDTLDLPFTCFGSGAEPVQVTAYPAAAGPNSPDAQTFGPTPAGQSTLQATYSRRGSYDVRLDCQTFWYGVTSSVTVPDNAFPPALTIRADRQDRWLYCDRASQLKSPATLSLAAQTPNAPSPLSVTGSGKTLVLTVQPGYFPNGDYQLSATCASNATPPFTAAPLTLSSSQIPMTLRATPSNGLQLAIACANPGANGIHAVAYPAAAGPNSPDAQTFDAPAGQSTLQATYSRRANYDVGVDCSLGGGPIHTVTVLADAFPPLLTIRADPQDRWLYCDRASQLKSPATLSLAAQTPNAPPPLRVTGSDKTLVLTVQPDYFPAGDYQLTATCASSDTPPFMATPLTLSSSQIPTRKVSAEITGCSAQGGNAYACALQVTLGAPLAVNTVFSVRIGGGGFANPSGGDSPKVTAFRNCQVKPIPSPYLAAGNGSYTSYDVNISSGGCTAGAVVTFGEAVTGADRATITQPVTVPGVGASTATFVLP
jgi:hypothetical protein